MKERAVEHLLAYEMYLKNKEDTALPVKVVFPIKKAFVCAKETVTVKLDSKTLEHYGENISQNDKHAYFKKSLSMPSNNLASVGLPYRATGAAAKKPYIEFFGNYRKGKLKLSISGEGLGVKKSYEYNYDSPSAKETTLIPVDSLVLRLDEKNYFAGDKPLFGAYKEDGIVKADGGLVHKVFVEVCRAFVALWKEKILLDEIKEFINFNFRIVVLPLLLLPDRRVEYHSGEDAKRTGDVFEDCFGNPATDYPSKATINAKFLSFDDEAFTLNCRTGRAFYQNLGIGNQSFPKINLPNGGFSIAGLDWYFFNTEKPSFEFEEKRSGIYDQLLSNHNLLVEEFGNSTAKQSALKIICTKKSQAKLEVLLDDNLTLDQLGQIFSRAQDGPIRHPMALESLITKRNNETVWTDYLTAVRHFLNGTFINRAFLVQRFTLIFREFYLRDWVKGAKLGSKDFFDQSQFCLRILTKNERGLDGMDKNEEYAYKIGCIAGKYVKFKRGNKEANNSTNDILTYSKYDRERLRFVYQRICIGVSLSKVNTDSIKQSIKDDVPEEEIDDAQSHEDYSYFFYKGVFKNLS